MRGQVPRCTTEGDVRDVLHDDHNELDEVRPRRKIKSKAAATTGKPKVKMRRRLPFKPSLPWSEIMRSPQAFEHEQQHRDQSRVAASGAANADEVDAMGASLRNLRSPASLTLPMRFLPNDNLDLAGASMTTTVIGEYVMFSLSTRSECSSSTSWDSWSEPDEWYCCTTDPGPTSLDPLGRRHGEKTGSRTSDSHSHWVRRQWRDWKELFSFFGIRRGFGRREMGIRTQMGVGTAHKALE